MGKRDITVSHLKCPYPSSRFLGVKIILERLKLRYVFLLPVRLVSLNGTHVRPDPKNETLISVRNLEPSGVLTNSLRTFAYRDF